MNETMAFPIEKIREDFPALHQQVNGHDLIYLDNAASAQKPQVVIDTLKHYYEQEHANIHRGVHHLSAAATDKYELSREAVRQHLNAEHSHEIVFTRGTSESINLVAYSFGKAFVQEGDEIIVSALEHHSNLVPWQILCEDKGATLKVIPMTSTGEWDIEKVEELFSSKTRLVAVSHVSNALGTVNPVEKIIAWAHERDVPVLLDGAQAVPHMKVDVQQLDCDFYAFSAHKAYGPTGVGVLYGKEKWLDQMPPYQGGGEMIKTVTLEKSTWNELPFKFEAGTPHIAGGIALKSALEYMNKVGLEEIASYEDQLLQRAVSHLSEMDGIDYYGTASHKAAVLSFLLTGVHPYDVGVILDKLGIAVRTGHHCTEPIMQYFGIPGTVRASFAFYNTFEEVDRFAEGLKRAQRMLS
ncbi:cysteine desulfurase [bacterium SCSIO 12741]|nr:cysteine desulfurase [bacterium SCSIO 12741]